MPSIQIDIRERGTPEYEVAVMLAVQTAMCEAFGVAITDIDIRLLSHKPHRFVGGSVSRESESLTRISIDAYPGRSIDTKRRLKQAILNRLGMLGIPASGVLIPLGEVAHENWHRSSDQRDDLNT